MTSPKPHSKIKTKIIIVLFFLITVVASLWPSDTHAINKYTHFWMTPYWSARYANRDQYNYSIESVFNSFGCVGTIQNSTTSCGNLIAFRQDYNAMGTGGKMVSYFEVRSASNSTNLTNFGYGKMGTISLSVWTPLGSDSFDTGAAYVRPTYLNDNNTYIYDRSTGQYTRPVFLPVGNVRNIKTSIVEGTSNNVSNGVLTTFDIDVIQVSRNTTGRSVFVGSSIYLTSFGGTLLNVDGFVSYDSMETYLDETNQRLDDIKALLQELKNNSSNSAVVDAIDSQTQQQKQQHDEDKQAIEDAQQDAQTGGSSSQTEATQTGSTLLQALTSFIGAISSASPSNCTIPMDTGFINFGNVNLCQLSPPPAFQLISSIVVIGFAVPLSIAASKKMIELFRSFTG